MKLKKLLVRGSRRALILSMLNTHSWRSSGGLTRAIYHAGYDMSRRGMINELVYLVESGQIEKRRTERMCEYRKVTESD